MDTLPPMFKWYHRDGRVQFFTRDEIEYIDETETWWRPKK